VTDHIHDLTEDAPRYVAAALKAVGAAGAEIYALVDNYKPPSPNNMSELVADERRGRSADDRPNVAEVKESLIINAIDEINQRNRAANDGYDVIEEDLADEGVWRFADGVDPDALVLATEPFRLHSDDEQPEP
jgi:hypothetical protein